MNKIIYNLSNEDYHSDKRICSSLLKAALVSPAHLKAYLEGKKKTTDSMLLGTAIHCWFLERERFENEYIISEETYQRATGTHKAGDVKLDEDGEPLKTITLPTGEILKCETAKKFFAMQSALLDNRQAMSLLDGAKTEVSFFTEKERVRADLITSDGYLVDLKTVGGLSDMPLEPQEFAKEFWKFGYDLQMYMYDKVARECGFDSKGFIFLCIDSREPIGVRIFHFSPNNDWFKYGEARYKKAYDIMQSAEESGCFKKYEQTVIDDLPIPYIAVNELAELGVK